MKTKSKNKLSNSYRLANLKLTAIRKTLFNHCIKHIKHLGCLPSKFSVLSLDAKQELLAIPHKDYHLFLKANDLKKLQKLQRNHSICNL
ncbi:MAG: hypothetical protein JXK16_06500 [Thiotrichales bacterium]|nr:hypothetical protein [Thiotrichales bacterium]